jgi:hypothetical protein
MGFSTNTQMSIVTPITEIKTTVGTWAINVASNKWTLDHTAAADTSVLFVPIRIPGNAALNAGGLLSSVDIFWSNATAVITDCTAVLQVNNLPAQAGSQTITTPTVTYDSGHLNAAARNTVAVHKMTISLAAPLQVRGDQELFVELTVNAGATSVFKLMGVKANWTLRV